MELTVVGTGRMGAAFVKRAAQLGHKVYAWNRTRGKLEGLPATPISRPSEARGPVAVFVADDEALLSLVDEMGGDAAFLMGTYSLAGAAAARRALAARGIGVLASPIVGGPGNVERGDAVYIVGGDAEVYSRYSKLFAELGRIMHVGEFEKAVVLKLAYNSLLIGTVAVLGEAASMAAAHGIPPSQFKELLSQTIFKEIGSVYIDRMYSDEPGTFALRHAGKDVRYATAAAAGRSSTVVLSAVRSLYEMLEVLGYGDSYYIRAGILESKRK
jgi:3-hydroxyisobutyrate dehydrogenase-like beta-hydroxyacid dehydrogenase